MAQSKKGDDYELLQPVYALNFVNENFMNDVDDYYHYYHLVHDKYTDQVIDGLHLIFVELKKFKPTTFSEKKMQVLWLRFLTEINDETREAPAELLENAEVSEALEIVERAAFDDGEMRAYDKFWDNVSVQKTLENARKREMEAAKREIEAVKREIEAAKREINAANAAKREAEKAIAEAKAEKEEAKAEKEEAKAEKEEAKAEKEKAKAEKEKAKAEKEEAKAKMLDTARKLKSMNVMTIEQIAEATGLTTEQVKAL